MTGRGPKKEEEDAPWGRVYPATDKRVKKEEGDAPWTEESQRGGDEDHDTKGPRGTGSGKGGTKRARAKAEKTEHANPDAPEDDAVRKMVGAVHRARASYRRHWPDEQPDHIDMSSVPGPGNRGEGACRPLVTMRNYAAVGVGDTAADEDCPTTSRAASSSTRDHTSCYGLIDLGPGPRGSGTRCLIMHSPHIKGDRRGMGGQTPTDRVRPGAMLRVCSTADGGGRGRLRVRFTTPEQYYAPGARVTTLRIGVDATGWESLTPKQRRII